MSQPDAERMALPAEIMTSGIVVVLRTARTERLLQVADCLVESGLTCLEVAFTLPSAPEWVQRLSDRYGGAAKIGAGTVLTEGQAREATEAGARYIVSAASVPEVLAFCQDAQMPCVSGALTPTEIWTSWTSGASAVKLFPAAAISPAVLASLRGPFPDILFMPTGGVDESNIAAWIQAGAVAVGVGEALVGPALAGGEIRGLRSAASRLLACVREGRASVS